MEWIFGKSQEQKKKEYLASNPLEANELITDSRSTGDEKAAQLKKDVVQQMKPKNFFGFGGKKSRRSKRTKRTKRTKRR